MHYSHCDVMPFDHHLQYKFLFEKCPSNIFEYVKYLAGIPEFVQLYFRLTWFILFGFLRDTPYASNHRSIYWKKQDALLVVLLVALTKFRKPIDLLLNELLDRHPLIPPLIFINHPYVLTLISGNVYLRPLPGALYFFFVA